MAQLSRTKAVTGPANSMETMRSARGSDRLAGDDHNRQIASHSDSAAILGSNPAGRRPMSVVKIQPFAERLWAAYLAANPASQQWNDQSMPLHVRAALPQDASAMARILNKIIEIGGTTAHREHFDENRIIDYFISPKLGISCFVALERSQLLGFQSLEWSDPDWPGDRLPAGWGIVATYVDPHVHKKGAGRALFANTVEAAKKAGVSFIDATIRRENTVGQAFYEGIGFTDYREGAETISKRFAPL
ncbi:N-acetyltransferase family protein [Aminobacter sp. BE322]|uniref:GNAT family N-acetyltransferase n=1 Tax=unclassified Aminobacter TaxID=2644704 RepID=UPI003D19A781